MILTALLFKYLFTALDEFLIKECFDTSSYSHVSVENIFDLNKMRIGLKSYETFYVK